MGIFTALRPKPGKFIFKSLPLCLKQTEEPIESQVWVTLGLSSTRELDNEETSSVNSRIDDTMLSAVVTARALTCATVMGAYRVAKHLSKMTCASGEAEYLQLLDAVTRFAVGSINPLRDKSAKYRYNYPNYLESASEVQTDVAKLTDELILRCWASPKIDTWKEAMASRYASAISYPIDESIFFASRKLKDKTLFNEATKNEMIQSYSKGFAESNWDIFKLYQEEILDLMISKGVCI